jgi:adenylate cyclase
MEDQLPRKLAAILYADVADYSRLTGEDEEATHRRLSEYLDLVSHSIGHHQGKVVHYAGDAVLADFSTVTNALECASSIQGDLYSQNLEFPDERKVQFRIGINLGEVIVDRDDIYGNGVNVAARLESLADAGGVCISDAVRTAIGSKLPLEYEFMGEQAVKNIKEPIRAYQVRFLSGEQRENSAAELPELPELELPEEPSIAVLSFTNMSNDPEQEYFCDGITEDITTALSRIPRLFTIARHSTSIYKGKGVEIGKVASEQGVRYVLEGSVRKSGNRLRITAQLIDAINNKHCWAERYDRKLDDVFEIQEEIARNVSVAVQVKLTAGEAAKLWAGGTTNVEAWESFVRGNAYMEDHVQEHNKEAKRLAELALSLDPDYANAWVLMGFTHFEDSQWKWSESPDESLLSAEKAANKAIDLEELNPDGYILLGAVQAAKNDFTQVAKTTRKAYLLAPNSSHNLAYYAWLQNREGEYRDSIKYMEKAIRLCPIHPPWYLHLLSVDYYAIDRYDKALQASMRFLKQVEADSNMLIEGSVWLAVYLKSIGRTNEAKEAYAQVLKLDPNYQIEGWWSHPRKDPTVREKAVNTWREISKS